MPDSELAQQVPPLGPKARPATRQLCSRALLVPTALRLTCAVALLDACGGDEPPPPPPEPPRLTVEALQVVGGGRWSLGQDDGLTLGCEGAEVLVELGPGEAADEIDDWILRPPGACGGIDRCGFVTVTLDPGFDEETIVDSASRIVPMALSAPGSHRLLIEFRNDDGSSPALDGGTVAVEVEFSAELPPDDACGPTDARISQSPAGAAVLRASPRAAEAR